MACWEIPIRLALRLSITKNCLGDFAMLLSSISTIPSVFSNADLTDLLTLRRPSADGPYISATIGENTGGPGGTSTTLTLAPYFFAISTNAGRIRLAIAWL